MIVEKTFIEDGFGDNISDDPFEVSDAETVFDYISLTKVQLICLVN